jgi:hypothetical protein
VSRFREEFRAHAEARWNALKAGHQIGVLALIVIALTALIQAAMEGHF